MGSEDNIKLVKVILEGIVKICEVIRCKFTCCRSSCNTVEEVSEEKNVKHI